MKCLYYSLVMLLNWGILNASEEPVKKVPDDSAIKSIIGLLDVTNNVTKVGDSELNTSNLLLEAVQWATEEYKQEYIELTLWNHGTSKLWDSAYRTLKFKRTSDFSNKN